MVSFHIIFIVFSILYITRLQQLVCYSKFQLESEAIYNYFYSIHNGIYIDLEADHPIIDSNTLYLSTLGWRGINIVDTKESQQLFKKLRKLDGTMNIQISLQLDKGETKMSLLQVCKSHLGIKPQFLNINLQRFKFLQKQNYWKNKLCRPELILIQQYSTDKIEAELLLKIKQNGYEQINTYENFIILVEEDLVGSYLDRQKENSKIYKNKNLVPFYKMLTQFSLKTINRNATIYNNLKNNIFAEEIAIFFARYGEVIDFSSKQFQEQIRVNNLIMEYNQEINILKFPEQVVSSQLVSFSENQKYRHLIVIINEKKISFFIFDHQFVNTLQVDEVVYQEFEKQNIKYLDSSQIPFLEKQQNKPSGDKQGDDHLLVIGQKYTQIEDLNRKNDELFRQMKKMSDSFEKKINTLIKEKQKLKEQNSILQQQIPSKSSLVIIVLLAMCLTALLAFFMTKKHNTVSFTKIEQPKMQSEVQQNSNSVQDDNGIEIKNINNKY